MTTTEQKLPSPNEYWRSRSGEIRLIVCDMRQHDSDFSGPYPIVSMSKSGGIATHDASGRDYNDTDESPNDLIEHLLDCTGFDWKQPAPIDPGDGWEVLVKPCRLEQDDEALHNGAWYKTGNAGLMYEGIDSNIYRRRKPTAEVWPKWYVRTSGADSWVYRADGRYTIRNLTCDCVADPAEWYWRHGNMVEITESEALARVKPAETWPKYVICDTWVLDAYIRRDSATVATGIEMDGKPFRDPYEWSEFEDGLILQGKWRYVTESEALARVKPAELCASCGKPAIQGTAGCKDCTEYAVESVTLNTVPVNEVATAEVKITPVELTATPLATAAVESPDDWVEITDTHPGHIRRACDEVCCKGDDSPIWIPVQSSIGMPQSEWGFTRIRCRRRDLPAQQPKRTPVRLWCYRYILKDGQSSTVIARHEALQNTTDFRELFYDGSGFYVEGE